MSAPTFAELFEGVLVPMTFRPWAGELLDRTQPQVTDRILDVACGTGIVARLARERLGPKARITGIDLNPTMIAVARSVAPDIAWHQGNAQQLPFANRSFDRVMCQQGLQFFPDRALAVQEMRRVLADGGQVALSIWRPLENNPFFHALHALAAGRFGPHVDRRFALGQASELSALLSSAGFRDVQIEAVTLHERIRDPAGFVALNLNATIDCLDEMPPEEQERTIAEFRAEAAPILARFADGTDVVHLVSAHFATARA